jgi:translation initiation factor IF-3
LRRKGLYWRFNKQIHAPKVRVIGEDGKQLGVVEINKALDLAKKAKLDLVEIAPKAKPPVVKIVELGKFKYDQEKKKKKEKKKNKTADLKEVRLSPFIGDHDFKTRLEKINEFLQEKHKVRVVVKFKGRQMGSKKFGYEIIKKVFDNVKENISVDMEPKFIGRHLTTVISPTSKSKKEKVTK